MGHLLTASFFDSVLGDRLVGLHPGMEVHPAGSTEVAGEADVLLLTRHADMIPIEVKRSATGMTESELLKLGVLVDMLESPWSAVVACQYSDDMDEDFSVHELRNGDGSYKRIPLSYDRLLSPHSFWGMGDDPFAWNPLSSDEIVERQRDFVKRFENWDSDASRRWSDEMMLKNPAKRLREIESSESASETKGAE
jgi:hypothetical protein